MQPGVSPFFSKLQPLNTTSPTARGLSTAVHPSVLLRVCTTLHHQQNSSDARLHSSLRKSLATSDISPHHHLTPEFFLRVCNSFPLSWRPVHRFYLFTLSAAPNSFSHSSLTLNKLLDVLGSDRNIHLFWEILQGMARDRLFDQKTFLVATKTFAEVRELKKCVEVFHLANRNGWEYSLETLNMVVENLCRRKLVEEAHHLVVKLKEVPELQPDGVTYGWLVKGYCEAGDLVVASKIWNLMADEGLEPDIWVCEVMMETLFKTNEFGDAMGILHMMRTKMMDRLGISTFRIVMRWLCKVGKVRGAYMVFVEMLKRGIEDDESTMSSLIYGLLARGRVREARKEFNRMKSNPDIGVYHGIITGLLKLRRASEATCVFREMIRRGCEPTMHTYIMLLQGHLGKRGRKGPDELVNFDSIFVGGLVKAGKWLEATKYVERTMDRSLEVPRFDYNKFLHYYSNDEGVAFFEEVSKKLREAGMVDLADILARYGEKMATRDRRRDRPRGRCEDGHEAMACSYWWMLHHGKFSSCFESVKNLSEEETNARIQCCVYEIERACSCIY